ncbi:MAG: peroxiredoxin [Novosphingobium sp.]
MSDDSGLGQGTPPGVGDPLPDVAMTAPDGGTVKPSDLQGKKAVIFFYPKDDTPGCTLENQDFTALAPDFAKAGVALLGVSKDSPARHQKFIAKYGLTAPLASDAADGGLSDALGIWAEKVNYGRTYMGMVRSTYLVDADGRIARVWSKVKVKGHAAEVLEAAKAL